MDSMQHWSHCYQTKYLYTSQSVLFNFVLFIDFVLFTHAYQAEEKIAMLTANATTSKSTARNNLQMNQSMYYCSYICKLHLRCLCMLCDWVNVFQ